MSMHPDLPDTLVHFTGRPREQDERQDFPPTTPEGRLVSILRGRQTFGPTPLCCASARSPKRPAV